MNAYGWYQQLAKPPWSPPAWLFGPVWTVLYILIAISFGAVFRMFFQGRIMLWMIVPFVLNLIFNLIFTPIQFGLRNNFLAMIDIFLVLGTLIWAMMVIYPVSRWITYIQIPYLLWVSFATFLQVEVTLMNR